MTTEWMLQGTKEQEPLHFNWCGLDDVYLKSGFDRICDEDGESVVIHQLDDLMVAIGDHLVRHKKVLNGKEIRFLRKRMGLTQKCLGKILRVQDQTVARWEKDAFVVEGAEDLLLRLAFISHFHGDIDMKAVADTLAEVDDSGDALQFYAKTDEGWRAAAA